MDFVTIVLFFMMRGESMPLSFAICDDSPTDRELIASLIRQWAAQTNTVVKLSEFTSAENHLFRAPEEGAPDILLLDIEMGAMDGISLAKKIRQSYNTMQVVSITGYSDYIAGGYEVSALHYLMKPVKPEKLFSVLDRAVEKFRKNERLLKLESGFQHATGANDRGTEKIWKTLTALLVNL